MKKIILVLVFLLICFAQTSWAGSGWGIDYSPYQAQSATPPTPPAHYYNLYFKYSDGLPYYVDSTGTSNALGGGCSSVGCGIANTSWNTYLGTLPVTGSVTGNHLICFSADGTSIVDCGAIITTGTGVATAAAIAVNTAGGFQLFPTVTVSSGAIGALTGASNYVICTGACNFTPPTPAVGVRVCARNAPNSTGAITINALGSVYYEKHDYSNWKTVNKNCLR